MHHRHLCLTIRSKVPQRNERLSQAACSSITFCTPGTRLNVAGPKTSSTDNCKPLRLLTPYPLPPSFLLLILPCAPGHLRSVEAQRRGPRPNRGYRLGLSPSPVASNHQLAQRLLPHSPLFPSAPPSAIARLRWWSLPANSRRLGEIVRRNTRGNPGK